MLKTRNVSTAPVLRVTFADGEDESSNGKNKEFSDESSGSIDTRNSLWTSKALGAARNISEQRPPLPARREPSLTIETVSNVAKRRLSNVGRNQFLRSFGTDTLNFYEGSENETLPDKSIDITEQQRRSLLKLAQAASADVNVTKPEPRRRGSNGQTRRVVSAGPILKRNVNDSKVLYEDILEIRGKDFSVADCDPASKVKENIRKQSARRRIRRIMQADKEREEKEREEREAKMKQEDNEKEGVALARKKRTFKGTTIALMVLKTATGRAAGLDSTVKEKKRWLSQNRELSRKKAIKKFRWAALVVRILCRFRKMMAEASASRARETAAQKSWNALQHANDAKEILFNMAIFQRGKSQYAYVPEWAKNILSKPPMERSELELSQLHSMCKGLQAYDKFAYRIQMAMCRAMVYQKVEYPRVILRKGHEGIAFYFIFSGSVFVNVEELLKKSGHVMWHTSVILHRGDSFGELALLRKIKRTASVVVREDVEMLIVDKDVFAKTCPKIYDKELGDKINFCKNLKLFQPWKDDLLKNICYEAQIQEWKMNRIIVKDSTKETEWIYICMQGQCSVIKMLDLKRSHRVSRPRKVTFGESYFTMIGARGRARSQSGASAWKKEFEESIRGAYTFAHQEKKVDEAKEEPAQRSDSDSDYDSDRDSNSERGGSAKERIIEVMALPYADMPHARGDAKYCEVDEGDTDDSDDDVDDNNNGKNKARLKNTANLLEMKMESDDFTFSDLMRLQAEAGQLHRDLVYLDVANLKAGDIFDMSEILMPTGRKLMMVSKGAIMLRMKRVDFLRYATKNTLKHARNIALETDYPTDDIIYRSYNERCAWEGYKRTSINETMKDVRTVCTRHHARPLMVRTRKPLISVKGVDRRQMEEQHRLCKLDEYLDFVYGPNKAGGDLDR